MTVTKINENQLEITEERVDKRVIDKILLETMKADKLKEIIEIDKMLELFNKN